jgi:hypothetical protein
LETLLNIPGILLIKHSNIRVSSTMFTISSLSNENVGFIQNHSIDCDETVDPCAPIVDMDTIFDDEVATSVDSFKADAFQPIPLQDIMSFGLFDLRDESFKFQAPPAIIPVSHPYYDTPNRPDSSSSDDILSDVLDELDNVTYDLQPEEIASISVHPNLLPLRDPVIAAPPSFKHLSPLRAPMMTAPPSFKHLRPCPRPKRRVVSDASDTGDSSSRLDVIEDCVSSQVKRQRVVSTAAEDVDESGGKFRLYQAEKWHLKFQDLVNYKSIHGHVQVPHGYKKDPALARWAKRQRYQYKLFQGNKASTMTEERIAALEKLGFVWDSHSALWDERYNELKEFVQSNRNANVPSTYPANPKLAIWVKCQRRQHKLLVACQPSNMTMARVGLLNELGFIWEIRRTGYFS